MNVFSIIELRKEIFSFLRTQAYLSCALCGEVCQWDECGPTRLECIKCFGVVQCRHCYLQLEYDRSSALYYSDYL